MKRTSFALVLLVAAPLFAAGSPFLGTWVERLDANAKRPRMTMTITDAGVGKRLITYTTPGSPRKMTVLTSGQGEDSPVLVDGRPTGQTMAIRITDARHRETIVKSNGEKTGESRAEISADGKVMKVDNETIVTGHTHKSTAYWDRQ